MVKVQKVTELRAFGTAPIKKGGYDIMYGNIQWHKKYTVTEVWKNIEFWAWHICILKFSEFKTNRAIFNTKITSNSSRIFYFISMLRIRDILVSSDPYPTSLTDPDVDPGGPTDPTDLEHWYIYIIFRRQKVIKKSQNSGNQGFSYFFCLIMAGSGSAPHLWLRIRMRIREAQKHMEPTDQHPHCSLY